MSDTFPSLPEQALNLGKAIIQEGIAIAKGQGPCTSDEVQERLSLCYVCPYISEDMTRCTLCGCNLEAKTRFRTATCPDNPPRW